MVRATGLSSDLVDTSGFNHRADKNKNNVHGHCAKKAGIRQPSFGSDGALCPFAHALEIGEGLEGRLEEPRCRHGWPPANLQPTYFPFCLNKATHPMLGW